MCKGGSRSFVRLGELRLGAPSQGSCSAKSRVLISLLRSRLVIVVFDGTTINMES